MGFSDYFRGDIAHGAENRYAFRCPNQTAMVGRGTPHHHTELLNVGALGSFFFKAFLPVEVREVALMLLVLILRILPR